jgi:site-specific DNA-methyltransferase (adenine-specific)
MSGTIYHADCLETLRSLPDESVQLVLVDPPFNTGDFQVDDTSGIRYLDSRHDYIGWLKACVVECWRVLSPNGSIYMHLGEKISYKVRLLVMDEVFGESNWLNTIIWHFDYGGRSKKTWSRKHETIMWYAKNTKDYVFNYDTIDRIPYMAPGLQKDKERAALGKPVTDTWWHTIVPTNGSERCHYPNQKPVKLYERIVKASSNPGDTVLDFCCGSGTTLVAAHRHGRNWIGIDNSDDAIKVMRERFVKDGVDDYNITSSLPAPVATLSMEPAEFVGRCGVLSHENWDDEEDPPVTCTCDAGHDGDHMGGTRCGTVSWPRVSCESSIK